MNYQQAELIMEAHKANVVGGKGVVARLDPDIKKLCNATYLYKYAEDSVRQKHYGITLFNNLIIDFYADFFEIKDDGWFGHTTHARLNEYMPQGFRVWGARYSHVSKPRPLGFVRTPAGVFPYKMPMTFSYGGSPQTQLEAHTTDIIAALPAHIERYLDALLDGKLNETDFASAPWYMKDFVRDAVEFSDLQYKGLTLQEIVNILHQDGAAAFSRSVTTMDKARHMELLLVHGMPPPVIHKPWLRKTLRPLLHDYVIAQLDFADVSWNRRDR